uniref:Uncharacterized protein n=1 Tax=Arundo donax TaxID=35708 RepID=A0A0A9QSW6_ARUDO
MFATGSYFQYHNTHGTLSRRVLYAGHFHQNFKYSKEINLCLAIDE